MKTVSEFPRRVVETPDMGITLSDGCRLSARVWMPEDAATSPVPAVLEYIPYRKRDGTLPRDELMHPYVAGHGYASVRVDMRGNGDSQGLMGDEYTEQELSDACEVIAWLAAQDWCTGAVGMMGKSWGGFNCLQTAYLQPPALKAVISVCSTTDRFADDIHYKGGCLLGENFGWGAVMLSYSSRPPDPMLRNDWREDWLRRLQAMPHLSPRWAAHQAKDAYWRHGSIGEDYGRMTVPVLIIGGWADNYMNTVDHILRNIPGSKGIVGPWVHQYPHIAVPGPRISFLQEALRWWDRWLKGIDTGVEADPALRAFMLDSERPDASAAHRAGRWLGVDWPGVAEVQRLWLGAGAGGAVCTPTGLAGQTLPPRGYLDRIEGGMIPLEISSPQDLGLMAGEFFPMGLHAEMPGDQAGDDARSVCFDGEVLAEPLALLGRARLALRVTSDKPLGFVVARLCDVGPDGASVRICHGMLNLCHRCGMDAPLPLVPGQAEDVTFDLDFTGYRVAAGHRLRLALSNAYWPFVWPSPEAGRITVQSGQLDLPLAPEGAEWLPPEAEAAPGWRHEVIEAGSFARRVERSLISGEVALVVEEDSGLTRNLDHGLCSGERLREVWAIHPDDPLCARAEQSWVQRLERGNWAVRTEVEARMTGTAGELRMEARLRAFEGEEMILERLWDDTVPRRFV